MASSIRVALDHPPEFYTNLDPVTGRVILHLSRAERIASVVVKLEGESKTMLQVQLPQMDYGDSPEPSSSEKHKILYKVQQIFPDEGTGPYVLQPGSYEWPFRFKIPFNNACSDVLGMARMGGPFGVGGFGSSIRVMDGTSQTFLQHAKRTLPPSLTGFPGKAEIRYYLKVTIQRPGLLKENWRYQIGFRFMPIEEPRPKKTSAEAFARRPFAFRPRSAAAMSPPPSMEKRKTSFFGKERKQQGNGKLDDAETVPPSIEMSALLPFPSVLTCNSPLPLRLLAKRKVPSTEEVYLTGIQIDLIGKTDIRARHLREQLVNRWVVLSRSGLNVPLTKNPSQQPATANGDDSNEADADTVVVPDGLWRDKPLPNTICPSFVTCNMSRKYEMEIKLSLTWGSGGGVSGAKVPKSGRAGKEPAFQPQTIHLPLHFSDVKVFSGIAPPPEVIAAMLNRPTATTGNNTTSQQPPNVPNDTRPTAGQQQQQQQNAPQLPPRRNTAPNTSATPGAAGPSSVSGAAGGAMQQQPVYDPLYPPQMGTPGSQLFDEAPPSYDEAMAEVETGPADGLRPRPAYSGVTTDVNGPSQIPEKS